MSAKSVVFLTLSCLVMITMQKIFSDNSRDDIDNLTKANDRIRLAVPDSCAPTYVPPVNSSNQLSYLFWDVTGAPFNNSVYTPYVTSIQAGLKLKSYFDYSAECTTWISNLISQIYYTNMVGYCATPTQYDIKTMVFYASQVTSTEFANSFYYTYLFGTSVYSVVTARINTFADFTDFYTSFLFNLLSQSLQISSIYTQIQTYTTAVRYDLVAGQWASLVRMCLDFSSSNSAGLKQMKGKLLQKDDRKEILTTSPVLEANASYVNPWSNLQFNIADIFNIPVGFLSGALRAIQTNTNSYYCSGNVTLARGNISAMTGYFKNGQILAGITQVYYFIQKTSSIVINCGNTILQAQLCDLFTVGVICNTVPTNLYYGEGLVQNILFNVGYQFTDVLNLMFIDPASLDPFWYYVSYQVGDFFVRFLYHD